MEPIIIKKYSNRRLYHTGTKAYITLEDLANLIREGHQVKVIDNQSKEDITQETLLQIILQGDKPHTLFTTPLLHKLIRLQNEQYQEFFQFFFGASIDYFMNFKQNMMQPFNMFQWWNNSNNVPNPADIQKSMWENMEKKFAEYEKRIQELQQQVERKEEKS